MFYLKFLMAAFWFFGGSLAISLYSLFDWRNPTNGHRFAVLFTHGATRSLGIKIKIHHEERLLANQPCVYIANHQDNADLVILGQSYPANTAIIGKKELLWIPFFGLLFYLTGNILLHRKKHNKAIEQMHEAQEYIMKKRYSVYMFPEGTRNKGAARLLPFKKGAFYMAVAAQVPLVPIVAAPNRKTLDIENKTIHRGTAHIEILEAIPTKGLTEADILRLIDEARAKMQEAFDRLTVLDI